MTQTTTSARAAIALALALTSASFSASADEPPPAVSTSVVNAAPSDPVAEIRKNFSEGVSLMDDKKYVQAAQKFTIAYDLAIKAGTSVDASIAPMMAYNVARAYQDAEKKREALTWYEKYLKLYPGAKDAPEVFRRTEQLRQEVPPDPPPVVVPPPEQAPPPSAVSPPPFLPTPVTDPAVSTAEKNHQRRKQAGWALFGVGATVVAAGFVMGGIGYNACPRDQPCSQGNYDLAYGLAKPADAAYVVGGITLAAGVVTLIADAVIKRRSASSDGERLATIRR